MGADDLKPRALRRRLQRLSRRRAKPRGRRSFHSELGVDGAQQGAELGVAAGKPGQEFGMGQVLTHAASEAVFLADQVGRNSLHRTELGKTLEVLFEQGPGPLDRAPRIRQLASDIPYRS